MEWDDKYNHWLIAPGSQAFDVLQEATKQDEDSRKAWRDLADRVSERFGLPHLEAFTFHQGNGTLGGMPIISMTVFGDKDEIWAITKVDPASWRKPQSADGGYPLKVTLAKRGAIYKALEEMAVGVPSYLWGIRGHLAQGLGKAAGSAGKLDSVFFAPGCRILEHGENADGMIVITNDRMKEWDKALEATGAKPVTCYEAMRAYNASLTADQAEQAATASRC